MAENYYETPKGILEILWRDGYHAAARLIERLQTTVSRPAEFEFMRTYIGESSFDEVASRVQLRGLWTAYCLHQDFDVDTASYNTALIVLWDELNKTARKTSGWSDFGSTDDFDSFDSFSNFMCAYLV